MSANVAATPISSVSTTEALAFLLLAVCWDQHQEIDRLAEGSPPASHGSSVSKPRVGCLTNTCETIDAQLLRRVRKPRRREPRRSQERDGLDPGGPCSGAQSELACVGRRTVLGTARDVWLAQQGWPEPHHDTLLETLAPTDAARQALLRSYFDPPPQQGGPILPTAGMLGSLERVTDGATYKLRPPRAHLICSPWPARWSARRSSHISSEYWPIASCTPARLQADGVRAANNSTFA